MIFRIAFLILLYKEKICIMAYAGFTLIMLKAHGGHSFF